MATILEPLFLQAEAYGKNTFHLFKSKAILQTSEIGGALYSRLLFLVCMMLFAFSSTVALALWLGEMTGKNLFGFLIVSGIYGLSGLVLFFSHSHIKSSARKTIVTHLLKS